MDDSITVAIITVVPPTLAVLLAWYSNKKAIEQVHVTVNSRMDELLKASKAESRSEGKEEGKIEEREEVAQRKE